VRRSRTGVVGERDLQVPLREGVGVFGALQRVSAQRRIGRVVVNQLSHDAAMRTGQQGLDRGRISTDGDRVSGGVDVEVAAVVGPGVAAGADFDRLVVYARSAGGIVLVDPEVGVGFVVSGGKEGNGDRVDAELRRKRLTFAIDRRWIVVRREVGVAGLRGEEPEQHAHIGAGVGIGGPVEPNASHGEVVICERRVARRVGGIGC
jgi:hypothetical protein